MKKTKRSIKTLRAYLQAKYGKRNYRIKTNGEVHVLDIKMYDTPVWVFGGYVSEYIAFGTQEEADVKSIYLEQKYAA